MNRKLKAAMLAVAAMACGCVAAVAGAPFRTRPDAVAPGELLGPFDGQAIDADTGRPIPGALVYGAWSFERGVGIAGPLGGRALSARTDEDGRYRLARLRELPDGAATRVARFELSVYKRGYVAYRSDRRFTDGTARQDFTQRANLARLDRLPHDVSHAEHLAFIGGAAPLRAESAWELEAAAAELAAGGVVRSPAPSTAPAGDEELGEPPAHPLLDASKLLGADELRAITGFGGDFEERDLGDLPTTPSYDSLHFKAVGRPERFDVALRVWKLDAAGAQAQYGRLLKSLPGAQTKDEIGDRSLRAVEGEILGLAFLDGRRGIVVQISCGVAQCKTPELLRRLAERVEERFDRLEAPAPAGPDDEPLPEGAAPPDMGTGGAAAPSDETTPPPPAAEAPPPDAAAPPEPPPTVGPPARRPRRRAP